MDFFGYVLFVTAALLAITFGVLYFLRPFIQKNLTGGEIAVLNQQFLPKVGTISVVSVCSKKYMIVANAHAIAISPVDDNSSPDKTELN